MKRGILMSAMFTLMAIFCAVMSVSNAQARSRQRFYVAIESEM